MTTTYDLHGVNLTKFQIQKLSNALKNEQEVKIRLTKENLQGEHRLPLTAKQLNKIRKAAAAAQGIDLTLSYSQLQHLEKTGGFLPLLALIPAIMGAVGAAGGLAGGIASAVNAAKNAQAAQAAQEETTRHNKSIEAQLASGAVSAYGSGVIANTVGKVPVVGNLLKPLLEKIGLGKSDCEKLLKGNLNSYHLGKGLYLRPYGGGLFLGPQTHVDLT